MNKMKERPYWKSREGVRYYYDELGNSCKGTDVEGKHIFQQIEHLKLWNQFSEGDTPYGLPYSFSSYAST